MNDMIYEARLIADMAGSGEIPDKDLAAISENFRAKYGCRWTEVLD